MCPNSSYFGTTLSSKHLLFQLGSIGINHLRRLAAEYQLVLKYRKEFHDMFTEFSDHSEFGPLMTRMRVVDDQGDSKMDEEQWEAASKSSAVDHMCFADIVPRYLHWVCL